MLIHRVRFRLWGLAILPRPHNNPHHDVNRQGDFHGAVRTVSVLEILLPPFSRCLGRVERSVATYGPGPHFHLVDENDLFRDRIGLPPPYIPFGRFAPPGLLPRIGLLPRRRKGRDSGLSTCAIPQDLSRFLVQLRQHGRERARHAHDAKIKDGSFVPDHARRGAGLRGSQPAIDKGWSLPNRLACGPCSRQ